MLLIISLLELCNPFYKKEREINTTLLLQCFILISTTTLIQNNPESFRLQQRKVDQIGDEPQTEMGVKPLGNALHTIALFIEAPERELHGAKQHITV